MRLRIPQLTTGPGWLTWAPDGRSLIYSMAGTLWRQALGASEAVQLTKQFGATDGHKFVNAVLARAAQESRPQEYGRPAQ